LQPPPLPPPPLFHRPLPLPRHHFQSSAHLLTQPDVLLAILSFLPFAPLQTQLCRALDPSQLLSPELFRFLQILLSQPRDVISVGAYPSHFHFAPPAVSFIEFEDLSDDQLPAPPVKQNVVATPDKVVGLVRYPHQSELHQGRLGQFEALLAFLSQQFFQFPALLGPPTPSPILLSELQLESLLHDLHRLLEPFPDEGGP